MFICWSTSLCLIPDLPRGRVLKERVISTPHYGGVTHLLENKSRGLRDLGTGKPVKYLQSNLSGLTSNLLTQLYTNLSFLH